MCDGYNLGHAQQHDQRKKEKIDIGLPFAVTTERPDLGDDLLARGGCGRTVPDHAGKAACLEIEPFDSLKK